MTAYFIAHGTVKNEEKMQEYVESVSPIVESFGGEFITVGEVKSILTGEHAHKRTAIFKFPDVASIEAWYNSDAYRAFWPLRNEAGEFDFIAVEEYDFVELARHSSE